MWLKAKSKPKLKSESRRKVGKDVLLDIKLPKYKTLLLL